MTANVFCCIQIKTCSGRYCRWHEWLLTECRTCKDDVYLILWNRKQQYDESETEGWLQTPAPCTRTHQHRAHAHQHRAHAHQQRAHAHNSTVHTHTSNVHTPAPCTCTHQQRAITTARKQTTERAVVFI